MHRRFKAFGVEDGFRFRLGGVFLARPLLFGRACGSDLGQRLRPVFLDLSGFRVSVFLGFEWGAVEVPLYSDPTSPVMPSFRPGGSPKQLFRVTWRFMGNCK